ncbi:OmpA family protein [Sphaerotilus sp.]|uniref:OmpA family protein n=1 Tax=Sphaerotilus sp. TaxID=2093942 RepID=UPI00286D9243|nr:OmpA family protein [Sphaerotilus sp.]
MPQRPPLHHAASRHLGHLTFAVLLALALSLAGCSTLPPPPITAELPLAQAVGMATDDAVRRMETERGLARFLTIRPTQVYVAPVLDAISRQQTATTVRVRELIAVHLKSQHRGLELVPFTAAAAAVSDVRLDTTLTAATLPDGRRATDRMTLALRFVSLKDGRTLARSDASIADGTLDGTPVAFFRESPFALMAADASATPAVPGAAVLSERERTVSIARLDEAGLAYSVGSYDRALMLYRSAATLPGADTMQALVGTYLASVRSGREDESRDAFSRIVALGLKTRAMGVKLLFSPGKTDYIADPAIRKPYPDWLREIARQAGEAPSCLQVIGHSSRTGALDFNLTLSAQRAAAVREQLEAANPMLARRIDTAGVAWRDNLVGTGSDDLKDAVDRRVEFKVVDCR